MTWILIQSQNFSRVLTRFMMRAIRSVFVFAFFSALLLPCFSRADANLPTNEIALLQGIYRVLQTYDDNSYWFTYPMDDQWGNISYVLQTYLEAPLGMGAYPYFLGLMYLLYGSEPRASDLTSVGGDAVIPALRRLAVMTNQLDHLIGETEYTQQGVYSISSFLSDNLTSFLGPLYDDITYDYTLGEFLSDWHGNYDSDRYTADLLQGLLMSFSGATGPHASSYSNLFMNVFYTNQLQWGQAFRDHSKRHPVSLYFNEDSRRDLVSLVTSPLQTLDTDLDSIHTLIQMMSHYVSELVGGNAEYQGKWGMFETNILHQIGDINYGVYMGNTNSVVSISNLNAIAELLARIHGDDFNYGPNRPYGISGDLGYQNHSLSRSLANDLGDIRSQLGFPSSNSLASVLSRFFDTGVADSVIASNEFAVAAITNSEVSLTNVVAQSERSSENVATNSPDFEEHRYSGSNPIDTGDDIFDLPQRQFAAVTPDLLDSSDSTIVIFNGNFPIFHPSSQSRSSSLSSSSVHLDISYPLRDNDDVSTGINVVRSIMVFVWDWVFLILSVAMLFSFYNSLTDRTMVNSGVGGLTLN